MLIRGMLLEIVATSPASLGADPRHFTALGWPAAVHGWPLGGAAGAVDRLAIPGPVAVTWIVAIAPASLELIRGPLPFTAGPSAGLPGRWIVVWPPCPVAASWTL